MLCGIIYKKDKRRSHLGMVIREDVSVELTFSHAENERLRKKIIV